MVEQGSTQLMSPQAWSAVLGLLTILIPALLGAFVGYLRYRVLMQRNETDRLCRFAEQANKMYELSLQERTANLSTLFLEIARLNLEVRRAELAHEEKLALGDDARPAKKAA